MKPSAYFINVARGPVVDDAALADALREGWIAGAALDVVSKEPVPRDNPLLEIQGQPEAGDHSSHRLGPGGNKKALCRGNRGQYRPFPAGRSCQPGLLSR